MPILRSEGCTCFSSSYSPVYMAETCLQPYEWRGLRQTRGLRSKARRVLSQFAPHDFTAFKWGTVSSFTHYVTVVLLLAVFLAAELNPFYLKARLFLPLDIFVSIHSRHCFGWNPTILSSYRDLLVCSFARYPQFENCSSILITQGGRKILVFYLDGFLSLF